jgi:ribosomal protein S18 acetylase RimI-like enzyme
MTNAAAISELDWQGAHDHLDSLAGILLDCVDGGASISFMWPFDIAQARVYWSGVSTAFKDGRLRLYIASVDERVAGTVQLWLDGPCNQKHRGDIRKLLVHRAFRRQGLGYALMRHAEAEACTLGLSLLTLDTVTDSPAEKLYVSLGWYRAGVIPHYAKWPDGRFCDATILFKGLIGSRQPD